MTGILSYKAWLIEPMFAQRLAPIMLRSMEQGHLEKFFEQNRSSNEKIMSRFYAGIDAQPVFDMDGGDPTYFVAKSQSGKNVAIIPMIGAITKNGDACSYGMRSYQNVMAKIQNDPKISGVVFHFNNAPGGSHDGTPEISDAIFNFRKNTVGFVDGMAASAHYYMASQTKHIMMNRLTDSEVGSIGSLIISENIQNMIDAGRWPSIEIIRAPQSVNKALFNFVEKLPDQVRKELNEDLKAGVDGFISDVKRGRGDVLSNDPEIFTGKMYSTDIAIEKGLADSKGTLQDAVNKAALPTPSKSSQISNHNNSKQTMSLTSKVAIAGHKVSSFFKKKEPQQAVAAEPAADGTSAPRWTKEMVFNTDGSGDGAFCVSADANGTDREFETKVDNNSGNEPPTDPTVTEDDFWSVVAKADETGSTSASEKPQAKADTAISKLSAELKESQAAVSRLTQKVTELSASVSSLQNQNKELSEKLSKTPAGNATTVVESEQTNERVKSAQDLEAEKYSNALHNNFL
jgi:protease-4